jgi:hypothetical protein
MLLRGRSCVSHFDCNKSETLLTLSVVNIDLISQKAAKWVATDKYQGVLDHTLVADSSCYVKYVLPWNMLFKIW